MEKAKAINEMLFFLKKLLQSLLLPPTLIFLLLIISIILIYLRKKWGKRLLLTTIILYYILSISPVSDLLLKGLENRYAPIETPPLHTKYVAVLGGGIINKFSNLPPTSRLNPSSTARLLEGIRLLNQINGGYLISSGGMALKARGQEMSCIRMKELAVLLGVDERKIVLECNSRDTDDEAAEIKKILGDEPFLLVTSGFHMPRSIYLFKKFGLNAIPAPCDFMGQKRDPYKYFDFLPSPNNLAESTLAVKEYVGLVFYRYVKKPK